ncbi:MAG: tetratricopeptide repeat protein [Magnetococcales bacterium]|nr:tetratricopeptide repeat protein [Magnetococcales bacterium]MBF0114921.1 tetratricopeptide repeat protein [Magnetococcales bacterium]
MERIKEVYRLHGQRQPQQALRLAAQLLAEGIRSPTLLNLAAVCSLEVGLASHAEKLWQTTLQLHPTYSDVHANLGYLYQEQGRFSEAEQAYRTALQQQPQRAALHGNLASLLLEQQRPAEAEEHLRISLQQDAHSPESWYTLGNLCAEQQRDNEAEEAYRQALQRQPDHPDAAWNFSLFLLQTGRFTEGWPLYEARYHPLKKERIVTLPVLPFPQWQGEDLTGCTVLVLGEQGHGDEIQFCRFLPLLKERQPAWITLACKTPLIPLLQSVAGVDLVVALDTLPQLPPHDYWIFLLSLPGRLGITAQTIPTHIPYLAPPQRHLQQWQHRLSGPRPKIGLQWQGSPAHRNDRNRSVPHLQHLAPLWQNTAFAWISLQGGSAAQQLQEISTRAALLALGEEIRDFADSAAIVQQLDLVISVDTALVHLCGALGIPCWVLLPANGTDWRWQLHPHTSPWYSSTLRLFRQPHSGDWTTPIEQVKQALQAWSANSASPLRHSPT